MKDCFMNRFSELKMVFLFYLIIETIVTKVSSYVINGKKWSMLLLSIAVKYLESIRVILLELLDVLKPT